VENARTQGIAIEKGGTILDRRVSVAPMMDWTDRHCRYFLRSFSPRVLLYTEMITAAAILRGDRDRLLGFDPQEHPLALQLGGSEPRELARAARAGADAGYDEINLNCGCPSDRVHDGSFGACLMLRPQLVAECVSAMRASVRLPVTVKARIGVVVGKGAAAHAAAARFDAADTEALERFVAQMEAAGASAVIVHARKAVLGGLSPKDNREIPPLRYEVVRALKERMRSANIVVNGGIRTLEETREALAWSDGVMLGREAYHRPFVLHEIDRMLYPALAPVRLDREAVVARMVQYAAGAIAQGARLSSIARHMLGLYAGQAGARDYRRFLSEGAREPHADAGLLYRAAAAAAGFHERRSGIA